MRGLALLIVGRGYSGHGLDMVGGNIFTCRLSDLCVSYVICLHVRVFYVAPMRELHQMWCDKNKLLLLYLHRCKCNEDALFYRSQVNVAQNYK